MDEKEWRTCRFTVNGLVHKVQFNQATIDNLFLPFLRRMTKLQQAAKQRIVVYLAAPPGVGKSTLALMMEKLSLTSDGLVPVQSLALDGFHYDSDYIRKHTVERDGRQIPMNAVKGCPRPLMSNTCWKNCSRLKRWMSAGQSMTGISMM